MAPSPPSVMKPIPPSPPQQQQPPKPKPASGVAIVEDKNGVTLEFQRLKAKELQDYFKQKKFEEANKAAPFFGFLPKNEISNGRWAMFGFAVGMLTEYATGSDFVDQTSSTSQPPEAFIRNWTFSFTPKTGGDHTLKVMTWWWW
ncbi:hypothetical protein Q3G72_022918 [Acer saccharum]|nr:hypothetical protein Q3G72_022918 [Acer saccharum]